MVDVDKGQKHALPGDKEKGGASMASMDEGRSTHKQETRRERGGECSKHGQRTKARTAWRQGEKGGVSTANMHEGRKHTLLEMGRERVGYGERGQRTKACTSWR